MHTNDRKRGGTLVIVGIVFLSAAFVILNSNHFTLQLNGRVLTYNRTDFPALFNAMAATAILVAAVLGLIGGYLIFRHKRPKAPSSDETKPRKPRRILWGTLNGAVLLLLAWLGYAGLASERLRGTNPDVVLCVVAFFVVALLAIARLHFARVATFRKPQWGRFPLNWSGDPLQALFVATCWWAGFVVGNVTRLFGSNLGTDKTVLWTVLTYAAILAGLLAGQAVGYTVYKDRIDT
jgi:hypothetical protein